MKKNYGSRLLRHITPRDAEELNKLNSEIDAAMRKGLSILMESNQKHMEFYSSMIDEKKTSETDKR